MPKTKVYSREIKDEVRWLRKEGWSLGEISQKIGIRKNTLSGGIEFNWKVS